MIWSKLLELVEQKDVDKKDSAQHNDNEQHDKETPHSHWPNDWTDLYKSMSMSMSMSMMDGTREVQYLETTISLNSPGTFFSIDCY